MRGCRELGQGLVQEVINVAGSLRPRILRQYRLGIWDSGPSSFDGYRLNTLSHLRPPASLGGARVPDTGDHRHGGPADLCKAKDKESGSALIKH